MMEGVTEGTLEGKLGEEEFAHSEISQGREEANGRGLSLLILFVSFDFPFVLTPVLQKLPSGLGGAKGESFLFFPCYCC